MSTIQSIKIKRSNAVYICIANMRTIDNRQRVYDDVHNISVFADDFSDATAQLIKSIKANYNLTNV